MMMSYPKTPQPIRHLRSGFAYGPEGLTTKGIARESPAELNELFIPGATKTGTAKSAAKQRYKEKVKKPWVVAQLRHYGIEHDDGDDRALLEQVLKKAIKKSECNTVPPDIRAIEQELTDRWAPIGKAHDEALKQFISGSKETIKAKNASARQSGKSPSVKKNGGSSDGGNTIIRIEHNSATNKTIKRGADKGGKHAVEVIIPHSSNREAYDAVEAVPSYSSRPGPSASKTSKAPRIKREPSTAKRPRSTPQAPPRPKPKTPQSQARHTSRPDVVDLNAFAGSYRIQCEGIDEQWPCDDMTLDIQPHDGSSLGMEAAFNFGVIEGVMLLSPTEKDLTAYRNAKEMGGRRAYNNVDEEEEEYAYDNSEGEADSKPAAGGKRKAVPVKRPSKKAKSLAGQPQRLYFTMRGRESGEGEIFTNENGYNKGYIWFDPDQMSFQGKLDQNVVGRGIDFQGSKVSQEPYVSAPKWSDFSQQVYDYESRARWGSGW